MSVADPLQASGKNIRVGLVSVAEPLQASGKYIRVGLCVGCCSLAIICIPPTQCRCRMVLAVAPIAGTF